MDLLSLNQELKQANDGLRQFAYVASHDLQEPLRKIRQFSEILVNTYTQELDGEGKYFLTVVSDAATRMSSLIRDLLKYSETSYNDFEHKEIDLSELISSVMLSIDELAKSADCKVSYNKLPRVTGEPTMIEQLFSNLISNGIKYKHPERPSHLKISSKQTKNQTIITVSDNGIGIEEDQLNRIFEPFTRLKNAGEVVGTGIGLAICKSVCDRHGWNIEARSTVNEGTKFLIKIPN